MSHNFKAVQAELARAKALHPNWPGDLIHQAAIMAEEAGEAVRAALNVTYHGGRVEDVRTELVQTAAMCLRMLEAMPQPEPVKLNVWVCQCHGYGPGTPCVLEAPVAGQWCKEVGPTIKNPLECAFAHKR